MGHAQGHYLIMQSMDFSHVSKLVFSRQNSNSVSRLKIAIEVSGLYVQNAKAKLAKFYFDHVIQGGCFIRVYQKAFQPLAQSVCQRDAATQEVFICIV